MTDNIQILKDKLNKFIDKYYANLLLKGIIFIPIVFFLVIFFVSWLEYINWFSINIRLFIFLFSFATLLFFVFVFLLVPLLKFFKIGKRLSDRKAAKIIALHFPDVQDKIINALELHNDFSEKDELIIAGINQKIEELSKFNFSEAVNFKSNLKIAPYLIIALLVFLLSFFVTPEIYTSGTKRLVDFNTEYVKEVDFSVFVDNKKLSVNKGDNLQIDIILDGQKLPEELFINYGNLDFLLEKITEKHYKYKFKNVNNNFYFGIHDNKNFRSKNYEVKVLLTPILKNYKANLIYPKYINKNNETFSNINEINVPHGSNLEWEFFTQFCDSILLKKKDTILSYKVKNNFLKISNIALKNTTFFVSLINQNTKIESLIGIKVNVIPDLYPSIRVNYVKDKTNQRLFYFKGIISDDFGFSKLEVHKSKNKEAINYIKNLRQQEFYYAYEFPKDSLETEIYFKVYDNDFVGGPKSAHSDAIKITFPKAAEIDNKQKEDFKAITEKLDKSLMMAYELERDIQEIKKSLINDNLKNWEKKKQIENLIDKHNQLNKIVNEIAKKNLEKDNFKNSFSESAQELLEKQKQIQELLENVMSDEIKKMLEELEKLSQQYNEDKLNELSKKMEINYDELSKELDRNLELLKKFEIEERINNQIENLKKLSRKQNKLGKELGQRKTNLDSLKKQNKKNVEELQRISKEYKENKEKNEELKNPMDLKDFQDSFKQIEKNILDNEKQIQDNEQNAKENAKQNAKDLKQLAENMKEMLEKNKQKEMGENADALRLLLNNLFFISFGQEKLMNEFLYIDYDNPKYIHFLEEQKKLTDDFKIVRDSLYSLSKRTPLIGKHISKSAFSIENEMINTLSFIEKRNIGMARRKQQEVLTSSNDMILLLSESLQKMDAMGGGQGSGNKKKKQKPKKNAKESLSDMKKTQESFKQQLQDMLNNMKQGKGKSKAQMGKMLAQQEVLQQMLNELLNNGDIGKQATKQLKEIKNLMEMNKRDLVNMQLSDQTFFRQKQIMTRLLEAEDAEQERDKENRREAEQARDYKISNPKKIFENDKEKINFNEIFNTKSINLLDFYKYKYIDYLQKIDSVKKGY